MRKIILFTMMFASTIAFAKGLSFPETITASCGLVMLNGPITKEVYVESEEIEGSQALEHATLELVRTSVSATEVVYEVKETKIFEEGAPSYRVGLSFRVLTELDSRGMLLSQLAYSITGPTGTFEKTIQPATTIIGLNGNRIEWMSYSHEAMLSNYGEFITPQRTGLVNCSISR